MKKRIYELVLPASMEKINMLEKFIENISDDYNIRDTYFSNILITMNELVTNAIIHGNKNDATKTVKILCKANEDKLIFSVIDEGVGFNWQNFIELSNLDNTFKNKGLFIAKILSDQLIFENNGTKVTVIFDISKVVVEEYA